MLGIVGVETAFDLIYKISGDCKVRGNICEGNGQHLTHLNFIQRNLYKNKRQKEIKQISHSK